MHKQTTAGTVAPFVLSVALVSCFFVLSILFFWDRGLAGISSNSDLVQPYLVVGDILTAPSAFYSWRHSPSPYVFPDMFISAIAVLLPLSPKWMVIFYSSTLLAGYALTGGWLVSRVTKIDYRSATLVFAICLLAALLAANVLHGHLSGWLLLALFAPFIHTGALLSTLIAMVLLERILRAPGSIWANGLLIAIVLMATFSDALFAAWFVLPALAVLWLHAKASRTRLPWPIMGALFVSAGVGITIERIFHGIKAGKPLRLDSIMHSAEVFWDSLAEAITRADWVFMILLAVTVAIVVSGTVSLRRSFERAGMPPPAALEIFLAISVVLGLLAPILTSYFQEQSHWRYLLFLPLFAVLKMAIFLSRLFMARKIGRPAPALAAAAAVVFMAPAAYSTAIVPHARSELEKCLLDRGLATGFGDYWLAKRLMFLSERRIHIIQIKTDGRRDKYNYNRDWFQHRADDGAPVEPNFIVMRGLNSDSIEDRFGAARETIQCAGSEIWLYDAITVP